MSVKFSNDSQVRQVELAKPGKRGVSQFYGGLDKNINFFISICIINKQWQLNVIICFTVSVRETWSEREREWEQGDRAASEFLNNALNIKIASTENSNID